MSLKSNVSFAIVVAFLVVSSLIFLGLTKTQVGFALIYFPFILISFSLFLFASRESFGEKKEVSVALVMVILVAVCLTFFLSSVKAYEMKNQEFLNSNQGLVLQLDNLTQTNKYYSDYLNYLNSQIEIVQKNSESLQTRINQLVEEQLEAEREAELAARRAAELAAQQQNTVSQPLNNSNTTNNRREDDD